MHSRDCQMSAVSENIQHLVHVNSSQILLCEGSMLLRDLDLHVYLES